MMRQDYILRLIGELRQFVGEVLGSGDPGRTGEALSAVLHAQQQLFHLPPEDFTGRSLDDQVDLLARGESSAAAFEKAATYAATLTEAARVYAAANRDALARSSRQLALGVLLTAAQRWPEHRGSLGDEVTALRAQFSLESLVPPVAELLAAWDAA
ncbi:MAG: hypothetical protein ACO3DQ_00185 [Cephaloticoccus sp.]